MKLPPNRGGQQPMQLPAKQTRQHQHCGIAWMGLISLTHGVAQARLRRAQLRYEMSSRLEARSQGAQGDETSESRVL